MKLVIIAGLLAAMVLVTSCSELPFNAPNRKFYEGNRGVELEFVSGSPPRDLFYREGAPTSFEVDVKIKNRGASLSLGGIYVSGYDPTLIDFQEVDEDRDFFDNCHYSINSIGFGLFDGFFQCNRVDLGKLGDSVGIGLGIGDIIRISLTDFNFGTLLDDLFNTQFFSNVGFDRTDISIQLGGGGDRLDVKFQDQDFDPKYGLRGTYFLNLWRTFDFTRNQGQEFLVGGDIPEYPGGEEDYVTFHGTLDTMPRGMDKTTQPIMITSCYLYTTHAAPVMCIDSDQFSETAKVCRPRSYNSKRGQGAPVAITSIVETASNQNEIVYRIEIENIGRGTVINPDRMDSCSPYNPQALTEEDLNVVRLGMVYIGNEMLECHPEQFQVRLYEGRGVATCVHNIAGKTIPRTGFEAPILVELWYGYSETIRKTISIKRLVS